ncbi:MAG: mucoidy inhibitor MuiA family protein [Bacteroidetes bacterium]|nr:mucoidy inhibitor MuiA family protein [Bacteroidota bacterium]
MKRITLLVSIMLLFVAIKAQSSADTSKIDGIIKEATVYFGYGAELTHEAKVKVNAGTKVIVINNLSTNVDLNTLQISLPENVALLSQRYSVFYPASMPVIKLKEVEKLEDSIANLQKSISRTQNLIAIEKKIIDKTGVLIESSVKSAGDKTISSTDLLKLVEYYNAKIEKSETNIFNYNQIIADQNKKINGMQQQIAQLMKDKSAKEKPYGQVFLQVLCKSADEIPVNLSYYTNNAGWTAVYDVRVNSKTNKIKLVYKAMLSQTSGIDWKKTKLTLSTGTPTFGVAAPILSPWYLQLYVPGIYSDLQKRAVQGNAMRNNIQSSISGKVAGLEVVTSGYGAYRINDEALAEVKTVDPSTLGQYTTLSQGQLNSNFEIDLPYDVPSDGQLQYVTIKDKEIRAIFKNYAVPRIDKEAYLLAEIADWESLDLLPGDANIIMDDTYIGRSLIDPNTTADTLNLALGRDKRVEVKRSLVKELSSLKSSGGSNKQIFTYEIVVKNNKAADVNLLLKDQIPLCTIKEVEISLNEDNSNADVNKETGVLSWILDLKPGEIKKLRFSYTVKYPKDKKIVILK